MKTHRLLIGLASALLAAAAFASSPPSVYNSPNRVAAESPPVLINTGAAHYASNKMHAADYVPAAQNKLPAVNHPQVTAAPSSGNAGVTIKTAGYDKINGNLSTIEFNAVYNQTVTGGAGNDTGVYVLTSQSGTSFFAGNQFVAKKVISDGDGIKQMPTPIELTAKISAPWYGVGVATAGQSNPIS